MIVRLILIALSMLSILNAEMFQSVPKEKAILIQKGDAKAYCPNCGMDLAKFYKTNHVHANHQYCSLHCLFESTKGVVPDDAKVVDTKTLLFVDVKTAFYVVGSNQPGTMSMKSKYAFANKEDANDFAAQNGGKVVSFEEAYAMAGEDFKNDVAMIQAKKEKGMYKMGQKMYEEACDKINVASFQTIADLKASLKESCQLDTEGQYQAVAIYLWDKGRTNTPLKMASKIDVPKDAKCPVCGMFVAKNPQWAAMIEINGKNFYFDGVKDLMKYIIVERNHFDKVYVTDYYKIQKLEAQKAFYVMGSNVYGPMGNELIPFSTEQDALTFARDHNGQKVVAFDEIDTALVQNL